MTAPDRLLSTFRNGFARANRYQVIMPAATSLAQDLNIMCDTISWPGRGITTSDSFTSMKLSKRPYAFGIEDISISFLLNNDWTPWNYINAWQDNIIWNIDQEKDYQVQFKRNFERQIRIRHLDQNNLILKEVVLKGAFPTALNSMELGNGQTDIMRVTATFSYDNWELVK